MFRAHETFSFEKMWSSTLVGKCGFRKHETCNYELARFPCCLLMFWKLASRVDETLSFETQGSLRFSGEKVEKLPDASKLLKILPNRYKRSERSERSSV